MNPWRRSTPARSLTRHGDSRLGVALYIHGMVVGASLLVLLVLFPSLFSRHAGVELTGLALGAVVALPMLIVYSGVPWIVDRYDPAPIWALGMALGWGGIAACGVSAFVNTSVHLIGDLAGGAAFGKILAACVSAPIVEELTKGAAVFLVYTFRRSEFDGVVAGVIYATFAALGFAAVEDILYYGHAYGDEVLRQKNGAFAVTFVVRGLLSPWCHPLFTSMTGLGFGIARETNKRWVKWLAPIGGYCFAVFLHAVWNTTATVSGFLLLVMLPLWFLFVLVFLGLFIYLVARKGRIIREHLRDEVFMGTLTPWELGLVTSPVGRLRATFTYGGRAGRRFVDASLRLALSKWHTGRAARGSRRTVSSDMIRPLRRELTKQRLEVSRALQRPVPQPKRPFVHST